MERIEEKLFKKLKFSPESLLKLSGAEPEYLEAEYRTVRYALSGLVFTLFFLLFLLLTLAFGRFFLSSLFLFLLFFGVRRPFQPWPWPSLQVSVLFFLWPSDGHGFP